jgi:glucokinase
MYLAGDIGGTKTVLGEFEPTGDGLQAVRAVTFHSRDFSTFEAILERFLDGRSGPPLRSACFGVAGTVVGGRVRTTNLAWTLDERSLAVAAGVPRVKLLNDLEATAYGVLTLPAAEVAVLKPGASANPSRAGNIAVVAAGTGLGEAMLYWDGTQYHPIASEAGHADFAPTTGREVGLWHYLRGQLAGRVSYERVLSGPGFLNIYRFLRDQGYFEEPAGLAAELAAAGDPNPVIARHGLAGDVRLCAETVAMFAAIYGAEAGNAALRCVAVGGVFLAGGIAPKLLPALRSGAFLDTFTDKGRFAGFMRHVEVSVSLNPEAALRGAAHYAMRL